MTASINLDLICATYGGRLTDAVCNAILQAKPSNKEGEAQGSEKVAKSAENLITRMLGILQGQGIYAAFLLLLARKDAGGKELGEALLRVTEEVLSLKPILYESVFAVLKQDDGILANLSQLLLAKRVMEQTLIYARYHAKAKGKTAENQANAEAKAGATDVQ